MQKISKWDERVLKEGNGIKWKAGRCWFGFFNNRTQACVINAWGRKKNLLFTGRWKGSNSE